MKQEREVFVEGTAYRVVLSDENGTLLAAKAAGRVPVGLLHETGGQDLSAAHFLLETLDSADEQYLERVVRRSIGLPWQIAESERLLLREFTKEDCQNVLQEDTNREADAVFYTPDKLAAYIRGQYGFYEYGLWAVIRKADGRLIGKAGLTDCTAEMPGGAPAMELGYHIFTPYRRQGYAEEACRMILDYAASEYESAVCADVERSNSASIALLEKLGFQRETPLSSQKYTESDVLRYHYVPR